MRQRDPGGLIFTEHTCRFCLGPIMQNVDGDVVCAVCRAEGDDVIGICGCGLTGANGAAGFQCVPNARPSPDSPARTVIEFGAAVADRPDGMVRVAVTLSPDEVKRFDAWRAASFAKVPSRAKALHSRARLHAEAIQPEPSAPSAVLVEETDDPIDDLFSAAQVAAIDDWRLGKGMTRRAAARFLVDDALTAPGTA